MVTSTAEAPLAGANPSPTRRLARFAVTADVDAAAREQAARLFVDTVAVTVAGGAEPAVRKLERALTCVDDADGVVSFWSPYRYRAVDAALLIGMASHVLDYDDVSMLAVCHPSAPILSAILACMEEGAPGLAVLDALAVGTEVMIRLGQAMGFRHYSIGFHATATLGTVGAAAACARLRGLDVDQTANAIAIAASHASGLRKNFGSEVKSLHVGMAASNGLRSAALAAGGIVGAPEILESEGYLSAFSGAGSDAWPDGLVLGAPFAVADPGFEQKRYPCCYLLHKIIEGTLRLRREHGLTLDRVAGMRVDMMTGSTKPLIHPFPKNGMNALFSGPYAVCAALEDGRVDLRSFTDKAVLRPGLQARFKDVSIVESDEQGQGATEIGKAPVTVTLALRDGSALTTTVVLSPGSLKDPLTDGDLEGKWLDCLARAQPDLDAARAAGLLREGLAIGACADVRTWLAAVRTVLEPT